MKKLPLLFFCVVIMLTSCSSQPASIAKNFSADITAICNGMDIKGSIVTNKHNIINLKITSPPSLKGYTYKFKNGKISIIYSNLKLKAEDNYLPSSAFPTIIYNILKSLNKENNCYCDSTHDSIAEFKGNSDSGKFTLDTEYSTGAIREIKINSIGFNAQFNNIKITG